MSINKRDLPLEILELLQPFLKRKLDYAKIVPNRSDKILMKVVDKEPSSIFHFIIESSKLENSEFKILVNYCPKSKYETIEHRAWIKSSLLEETFGYWLELLEKYSSSEYPPEDPILKQYEEEFEVTLNIVDEDADYLSFDLEKQLKIEQYLTDVKDAIVENIVVTSENTEQITELNSKIDKLRDELSSLTKKETMSRLGKIWAAIRKISFQLCKKVIVDLGVELFNKFIRGELGS